MSFPELDPVNQLQPPSLPRVLRVAITLALLSMPLVSAPALAQNQNLDLDSPVLTESPLERGMELYRNGSYLAAVELFSRATGFEETEGILGASRSLAMLGEYEHPHPATCDPLGSW